MTQPDADNSLDPTCDPNQAILADLPPYLTAKQVAELFHVATRTVDRWTAAGRIRAGTSKRLYPRPEIVRFVHSFQVAA